jgi:RNA polymerase sigma-70 factor, ECF subfamily
MEETDSERIRQQVETVYRIESRRILATLIRLLGDFDRAEEALQEAFAAAMVQWIRDGIPANPRAWLVSVGKFKAIDSIRCRTRFDTSLVELAQKIDKRHTDNSIKEQDEVEDDRLSLIFTCCHPALSIEAQVALTLREVCGLTTEEIASAFLIAPSTLAQRIVRAKAKIRNARIPYLVPGIADLPDRLEVVLQVVYLVFNEGYAASSGTSLTRADLANEAIRFGRLIMELIPDSEAIGLLALMLLQESRRSARTSSAGNLILLEDQDRSLWNQELISEGRLLVQRSLTSGEFGTYTIQAAIAAVHSEAETADTTDWTQIVSLYDLLVQVQRSPVVELNRAVALAMRDGYLAGLQAIDQILARGDLLEYHLSHSARAELFRRLGRTIEAREAYQIALNLVKQEPERRFLEKRLSELD